MYGHLFQAMWREGGPGQVDPSSSPKVHQHGSLCQPEKQDCQIAGRDRSGLLQKVVEHPFQVVQSNCFGRLLLFSGSADFAHGVGGGWNFILSLTPVEEQTQGAVVPAERLIAEIATNLTSLSRVAGLTFAADFLGSDARCQELGTSKLFDVGGWPLRP